MKRSLIIFTLVFSTLIANSQIVFNKIIEDTVAHITSSVIALDTGYVILTGTNNENLTRCFALTYIDENGNKIWKRIKGDSEFELWEGRNNSFKETSNGYDMTGLARSMFNDTTFIYIFSYNNLFEIQDSIKIKYDSLFKRAFNQVKSVDNSYYVVGQNYNYNVENYELLILKIDSNKNVVWEKSYGSIYEAGFQIIETTDKNILIGGLTFSFPVSNNDEDWYLIKVDTAGTVIWEKGFGNGSLYDGGVSGIIEAQDSNYIACGGYPVFEVAGNSFFDGCLRKVSRDVALMWTKYYRSYSKISNPETDWTENFASSIIYKDVDLFILGNCRTNIGASRGYLQKITETGDICWNREYFAIDTTSTYQWLTSIKNTNDGGFIIAGYGNEYDRQGYSPPQQAWLIKTDSLGIDGLCYTAPPELNIDLVLPETVNCNDTITVYAYIAGKSAPYTIETSIGQVIDSIYYPPVFVPVEIGLSQTSVEIGGIEYYSELITEATLSNHEWGQCIAKPVSFYTPHTSGNQQINITVTDAYGESKTITKEVFVNDCGQSVADKVSQMLRLIL